MIQCFKHWTNEQDRIISWSWLKWIMTMKWFTDSNTNLLNKIWLHFGYDRNDSVTQILIKSHYDWNDSLTHSLIHYIRRFQSQLWQKWFSHLDTDPLKKRGSYWLYDSLSWMKWFNDSNVDRLNKGQSNLRSWSKWFTIQNDSQIRFRTEIATNMTYTISVETESSVS